MVPGLENHRAGRTWGGWELGKQYQFSLLGMCNSWTFCFNCFCFIFPLKMMFVLVWLVWFLLFTLLSDSVSTSEHGHRAYVVPKAKLLYHRPQVHKADHHVWQSYCNEDPTERGRRALPDTRGTQCEELGLFPVGCPHCAFSLCKKPEGGTPEGLHEKLPAETSSCGPGVYEL